MPKRSALEKLQRYKRKIRKIEEQENRRRRVRQPLDSSEDENYEGMIRAEPGTDIFDGSPSPSMTVLDNQPDEVTQTPLAEPLLLGTTASEHVEPLENVQGTDVPTTEPPPEPELDPDLLMALGASTSDAPDFGERIHDSLASLWTPLLKNGLPRIDKDNLTKEYIIPVNCTLLQAPKLNAEMAAAVSETVRGRDKKLAGLQQTLGAGTTAINRGMDSLLKSDNKTQALKYLSDGCRLLSDLHNSFTKDRVKLIIPSIDKNILHAVQDIERDDTLFGISLGEKIKACKAIQRQGFQIRKATTQKPQPSTSRNAHQGNWTGPPRYPSNRGGRGGQRRPTSTVTRRTYPAPITQRPSRSSNQSKNLPNIQQ